MSRDFLFEIGCEELPSGSVLPLAQALETHIAQSLEQAQLHFETKRSFATPRRLAILITGLQEKQAPQSIFRRGPTLESAYDAEKNPTPALLGFARSCGVTHQELTEEITPKGHWIGYEKVTQGTETKDLLVGWIHQALAELPIKKMMHWGNGDHAFVRPVHWILLLWGDDVLEADFFGAKADRLTYGHRFHHPQAIPIQAPNEYMNALQKAFVIADFHQRRQDIQEQITALALQHTATPIIPDALLDEVSSIVEWPQAVFCQFAPEFLNVPHEALVASMQSHQKCFPLKSASGQLLSAFIAIANIETEDKRQLILGNEKVMRARLSDASFFFNMDKKRGLIAFIESTKTVLFQEKLGSLYEKTERVSVIMQALGSLLTLDPQEMARATLLSKCDLMTGMVGEFPELEGIMGYYYARADDEPLPIALALKEQYLPRFSGDSLPSSPLGIALSLADRLDTLSGIFALGYRPSGVKDPFKLRRHALAIARLLMSSKAPLNLSNLLEIALTNFKDKHLVSDDQLPLLLNELKNFILERLQSFYQANGVSVDCFQSVKARQADWLYDFDKRLVAMMAFAHTTDANALSASCKRVTRLLQQIPEHLASNLNVNEELLEKSEEKALWSRLKKTQEEIRPYYNSGNYSEILTALAALREPIDVFFEHVMIMVDNPALKQNRLLLLSQLNKTLQGVAEISLLQHEPAKQN